MLTLANPFALATIGLIELSEIDLVGQLDSSSVSEHHEGDLDGDEPLTSAQFSTTLNEATCGSHSTYEIDNVNFTNVCSTKFTFNSSTAQLTMPLGVSKRQSPPRKGAKVASTARTSRTLVRPIERGQSRHQDNRRHHRRQCYVTSFHA